MNENWEKQKAAGSEKAWMEFQQQTGQSMSGMEEEFKEMWGENYKLLDTSAHPRGVPVYPPEPIEDKIARVKHKIAMTQQQRKMMRPPSQWGMSELSYSTAPNESDSNEAQRNANRQTAPVGWEAGAGQGRSAVMGILGGRGRRR